MLHPEEDYLVYDDSLEISQQNPAIPSSQQNRDIEDEDYLDFDDSVSE